MTVHPCTNNEFHICETDNCGGTYSDDRFAGDCDPNGCDFNPYRLGVQDFYGAGKTVDTGSVITYGTNPPLFISLPQSRRVEGNEETERPQK